MSGTLLCIAVASPTSAPLTPSDTDLVRAISSGDRAALSTLYDRYASAMLALSERMFGNRTEAEDLLHDLFLEIWQEAKKYDESRGSVKTWLFLRLRSRACDRLRSYGRVNAAPLDELNGMHHLTDHLTDQKSWLSTERVQLENALRGLPTSEVLLLQQVYVEGHSLAEIAERAEAPLGTIKSRLNRALTHLREALAVTGSE